MTTDEVIATL
jgi:hypothetical protein